MTEPRPTPIGTSIHHAGGFPSALAMWYLPACGRLGSDHGDGVVIRVGIVGTNYGRTVQLPAFRADPRCAVVALPAAMPRAPRELAREADVPKAYGDWRALVERRRHRRRRHRHPAAPAAEIAHRARSSSASRCSPKSRWRATSPARARCCAAGTASRSADRCSISISPQIMAWQRAKAMLDDGAIGRCVMSRSIWHVENRAHPDADAQLEDPRRRRRRRARQFRLALFPLSRMVRRPDRRPVGAAVRPAGRCRLQTNAALALAFAVGRRRRACR